MALIFLGVLIVLPFEVSSFNKSDCLDFIACKVEPFVWIILNEDYYLQYCRSHSGPEVLFKTCVAMKFVDDDDDDDDLSDPSTNFGGRDD